MLPFNHVNTDFKEPQSIKHSKKPNNYFYAGTSLKKTGIKHLIWALLKMLKKFGFFWLAPSKLLHCGAEGLAGWDGCHETVRTKGGTLGGGCRIRKGLRPPPLEPLLATSIMGTTGFLKKKHGKTGLAVFGKSSKIQLIKCSQDFSEKIIKTNEFFSGNHLNFMSWTQSLNYHTCARYCELLVVQFSKLETKKC